MNVLRSLSLLFLLVSIPISAMAQATPTPTGRALETLTSSVASELRCPVCRGLSIEASTSDLALEMRGLIREKLAAGESTEEVKAYFVEKYGEWILLSPPKRGFTLLVWVLPVLGLLTGGLVLARVLRRWLPPSGDAAARTRHGEVRP